MRNLYLYISVLLIFQHLSAQSEIPVIENWIKYSNASNSLYNHIADQAYNQIDSRTNTISEITTLADWQKRQKLARETLSNIIGSFPKNTALNAKIVQKIDKSFYSVEHIIYESQPEFYVTSSLFIPKKIKKGSKTPVIIYCSGHTIDGYHGDYQQIILNLVKKGFIVFAFDPIGQGERLEYTNQPNANYYNKATRAHSYVGAQVLSIGNSLTRYMVWDGIRAVDYLLTRKEVDTLRIGITGRSGGGTQASLIAAMDNRIYASATENYITNYKRLFESIGPQDAEQNLPSCISKGIDFADFLTVRAPKPSLILATTGDFFSIQGFKETADEVTKIYKAYGKEGFFNTAIDIYPAHKSTKNNRESMYAFFQKHLRNPGASEDEEIPFLTKEEIQVTSTGQVSTSLGGETVFSLNKIEATKLLDSLNVFRKNLSKHLIEVLINAEKLSGYKEPKKIDDSVLTGCIERDGYIINKHFVKGEGDYVIPYLLMVPKISNGKSLIYLHPSGKSAETDKDSEIEWFVKKGFTVLAPDIIGTGETGPNNFKANSSINGVNYTPWFGSILIGRSILGIRASDVVKLAKILKKQNGPTSKIYGVAKEEMCAILQHSAALYKSIVKIALIKPFHSYSTFALNRFYSPKLIHSLVPGAIKKYDLPDLTSTLAPRKLLMVDITDFKGDLINIKKIESSIALIKKAYQMKGAENQVTFKTSDIDDNFESLYSNWIQ